MRLSNHILILGWLLGWTLSGCDQQTPEEHTAEVHTIGDSVILITPEQQAFAQILTDTLQARHICEVIRFTGSLDVPPDNLAAIYPPVRGLVKTLTHIIPGQQIAKGQTLVVLQHQDYIELQNNYLQTISQLEFMSQEFERQRILNDENASAKKNFQRTESEYHALQARKTSMEAQLLLIGIDPAQVSTQHIVSSITIRAPFDGYIGEVNINAGSFVDVQTKMFTVINKAHIHAELHVFEKDILRVKEGQQVVFRAGEDSQRSFRAKVSTISQTVHPASRTIVVHAHMSEETTSLKVGMYITGEIHTEERLLPAIPRQALVREGQDAYVFVEQQTGRYRRILVRPGSEEGDHVALSDVHALTGQRIVVQGANYLASGLRNSGEEEHGHTH